MGICFGQISFSPMRVAGEVLFRDFSIHEQTQKFITDFRIRYIQSGYLFFRVSSCWHYFCSRYLPCLCVPWTRNFSIMHFQSRHSKRSSEFAHKHDYNRVAVIFGTPLAYMLARWKFRLKSWIELLIDLPIVLPPSVAGLVLLIAFGRRGIFGSC